MTVSRALSNHPNVLKETRDAVTKRADELGYVKSAAAKAMRGGQTQIVGLLLPNITNEFYARFANTLALACETHSLQLIIHLTGDSIINEEQALKRLHEVQAKGVVMVPAPGEAESEPRHIPQTSVIQLIRQRDIGRPTRAILVDDQAAIQDAVHHLSSHGHQRISYVGTDTSFSSGRSRLTAFRAGLRSAGLREIPELIRTDAPSAQLGEAHAREILRQGSATALVCGGFEISNGALNALIDARADPSGGFGFIGYGDPSFYARIGGGISTIQVPVEHLAKGAADLLASSDQEASSETQRYAATLVTRNIAQG